MTCLDHMWHRKMGLMNRGEVIVLLYINAKGQKSVILEANRNRDSFLKVHERNLMTLTVRCVPKFCHTSQGENIDKKSNKTLKSILTELIFTRLRLHYLQKT